MTDRHFQGQHLLSTRELKPADIAKLFQMTDCMRSLVQRSKLCRSLQGAQLGLLFCNHSLRTKASFQRAFQLLGGVHVEYPAPAHNEPISDYAQLLSAYCDVLVMRHAEAGQVAEFAKRSQVPVINAGDGDNEHPTQALLDLYTLVRELHHQGRELQDLRVALVGDLKHSSVVHSFAYLLCAFRNLQLTLITPPSFAMPESIVHALREAGHQVMITDQLQPHLSKMDMVYQTRIQKRHLQHAEDVTRYGGQFRVNQYLYAQFNQPNTILMNAASREQPFLTLAHQLDNGTALRMALLALILGIDEQVQEDYEALGWHTTRWLEGYV